MAIVRSKNAGTQRPLSLIFATRAIAAGLMMAIHKPPSEANDFCGAK